MALISVQLNCKSHSVTELLQSYQKVKPGCNDLILMAPPLIVTPEVTVTAVNVLHVLLCGGSYL